MSFIQLARLPIKEIEELESAGWDAHLKLMLNLMQRLKLEQQEPDGQFKGTLEREIKESLDLLNIFISEGRLEL